MTTPTQPLAYDTAIHACLAALAQQLADAHILVVEARDAMDKNERNLAIGTVMPLEQSLPECEGLLRAVFTMQKWRNRMPRTQGGAQ